MPGFAIDFLDVPESVRTEIRKALQALDPPKDCVEDYWLIVQHKDGKYWLGHQTAGKTRAPILTGCVTPTEVALVLKKYTLCW